MMFENAFKDYEPVRIVQDIIVSGKTMVELLKLYPHSEVRPANPRKKMKSLAVQRYFKKGTVIDYPSEQEKALFNALDDSIAVVIPQHRDGYDVPTSGVARSRKASSKGRDIFLRESQAERFRIVQQEKLAEKKVSKLNRPKGGR